MAKSKKIPVYGIEQWSSGMYIKPVETNSGERLHYARSEPHRHDFYYVVLIVQGSMAMEVDHTSHELADRSLFLSFPGQIHSITSADLERGWFLAFDPGLLDQQIKDLLDQCLYEVILINLTPDQSGHFYDLIKHLFSVYLNAGQPFQASILKSLLSACLYEIAGLYFIQERQAMSGHSVRNIEITKLFRQHLRRDFMSLRKASQYAERMHMTLSHLNDTVKGVTGFSVTYHIQQELMREARRLISYSSRTIREIAYDLGFEDDKYFSRLFKKTTGKSPGSYRKRT